MNYLQLCQRLRQEVGGSGDGPASVTSQTGENRLYVDWINQAWTEIQNLRVDWDYHWSQMSITLTSGQSTGTLPADFRTLKDGTLYIGIYPVSIITWDQMSDLRSQGLNTNRPTSVAIAPDGTLYLNATCDQNYTLTGEYFILPQSLTSNVDIPLLPSRFHMMIVYKAMMYYASYENAPEVGAMGNLQYQQMLSDTGIDELPLVTPPGPIA